MQAFAQPSNDDCSSSIFIPDVTNYCSGLTEYDNINATPDPVQPDLCLQNYQNGVWFAFQPLSLGVFIEVIGTDNGSASLQNPTMSLFLGNCNNLDYQICSPGANLGRAELSAVDLFLGATYYLYVESNTGSMGTFQLCITEFNPVPVPESDCPDAVTLCDKSPFFVEFLGNQGNIPNEITSSCLSGESSSAWYQWTCDQAGTLEFTLTPNDFVDPSIESDDLDFVVYRMSALDDCSDLQELRCMASGENLGQPFSSWSQCSGPTGLLEGDGDVSEAPGCQPGNNNFVEAINMVPGESYMLVINNFSVSGLGYSIEFGGTGTFLGPEADFTLTAVDEFECDKSIIVDDIIMNSPDPIVEYQWSFGNGADIGTIEGPGPHTIVYESFGEKLVALTVTTSRGCVVTQILDIFINPCCSDTSNLAITASALDVDCFGDETGVISALGTAGNPEYSFSLDGENFSPISTFAGLGAGEYTVFIQDIKGCLEQTTVTIVEPDPFIIDAGEDMEVALGCSQDLLASYTPPTDIVDFMWQDTSLSCVDCLDPTATPLGTTTYVIEGINQNGCVSTDSVTIATNANRDFFAPNIFSPIAPSPNDKFMIGTAKGTDFLNLFVYDRWGELMYMASNVARNDFSRGWDGSFNNQDAVIGVYTWMAEIHYLDGVVNTVAGDVTLVR